MKLNKSLLFVLAACSGLLLFCGFVGQARVISSDTTQPGTPAVKISDNNIPKPRIVFDDKLLDFGKIGPDTQPKGQFRFENAGNATLEITKVSQCCGIVTKLKDEKSKYEPGEKGVIQVTYNATSRTGSILRQPIVYSNDPVEPNLVLTVTAEIVNKVAAQPDRLKLFLDEDNAKCPKVTLKSTDNQPFSIKKIQSTGNSITAKYDPNEKATQFVLDFKVDMAKLEQNSRGNVDLVITHPEMSLVTIPFDVLSKFTVNPPMIIAINAEPGEPVIRKIWVFNNYDEKFEIESVSSKNKYFTILSRGKVNDGYQFEVQLTPPAAEGRTGFTDELYIQIKDGEKLKIDCKGYYTPVKTPQSSEKN
jgi:hypothetical protein